MKSSTITLLIAMMILLSACALPGSVQSMNSNKTQDIYFEVEVPNGSQDSDKVYVEVINPDTNMATRNLMSRKDINHFELTLPLPDKKIAYYRYFRENTPPDLETDTKGAVISQRLIYIDAPLHLQDIVSSWMSAPYGGPVGSIQGLITYNDGSPAAKLMVSIAGSQTQTGEDGQFEFNSIRPGTHMLVVYSSDPAVVPFQQQAMVAPNMITPVNLQLNK